MEEVAGLKGSDTGGECKFKKETGGGIDKEEAEGDTRYCVRMIGRNLVKFMVV